MTDDTYFTLTTAPTHGIATIHPESGNWTYTPNANYFGNDAFQVTVTDDLQGTTPALLQITVTPVDDPAIITGDFNATIAEDGAANGDLNAVDIEGLTDDTYFTLTTAPTHGIATIHPESGNWTYTPNANYFGNDGFQVTVTDDLQGTTPPCSRSPSPRLTIRQSLPVTSMQPLPRMARQTAISMQWTSKA